jgi:hypothetical protein
VPLSGKILAFALVLFVSVKSNNLFSLVFYLIHKAIISRIGIRPRNTKIRVNVPIPLLKFKKAGLAA